MVFTPMAVHLLGGAVGKYALLAPWRLAAGLPLVALAFLVLRKRLQRPASPRTVDATA